MRESIEVVARCTGCDKTVLIDIPATFDGNVTDAVTKALTRDYGWIVLGRGDFCKDCAKDPKYGFDPFGSDAVFTPNVLQVITSDNAGDFEYSCNALLDAGYTVNSSNCKSYGWGGNVTELYMAILIREN
jgi:hypothetical protein